MPTIDPRDFAEFGGTTTPGGCELGGGAVREQLGSASNATGRRLEHYCKFPVWTKDKPHPDGAELTNSGADGTFAYIGRGAALNDVNGHEADSFGQYLLSTDNCLVQRLRGASRQTTSDRGISAEGSSKKATAAASTTTAAASTTTGGAVADATRAAGLCQPRTVRAAPEESRGGPINYSDADAGELVPNGPDGHSS